MRRHVPALSLLGSLILLPTCGSPPAAPRPEPLDRETAPPGADPGVEIHTLRHAAAGEIAAVVDDLLGDTRDTDVRIVADARRNALIVYGDPGTRRRISDLVDTLDRPAAR